MLLVNLDTYKTSRSITKDDDDAELGLLLEQVSTFVKNYCGRSFIDYYAATIIEVFDGAQHSSLYLSEIPLRDVKEVSLSYDGGMTFEKIDAYNHYFINKAQGTVFSGRPNRPIAPGAIRGVENVKVEYRGGFKKTPADLELAVINLVTYYYGQEYNVSKQLKDTAIQHLPSDKALPGHIKRTLELYRVL